MTNLRDVFSTEDYEIMTIFTRKDKRIEVVYLDHRASYEDGEVKSVVVEKEEFDEILGAYHDN